jgi:hypothetical protein
LSHDPKRIPSTSPNLLPLSTWWVAPSGAEPRIAGMVFYPNLAVAALFLLLTAIAALWGRPGSRLKLFCHQSLRPSYNPCSHVCTRFF